jgi:hypothetical protein
MICCSGALLQVERLKKGPIECNQHTVVGPKSEYNWHVYCLPCGDTVLKLLTWRCRKRLELSESQALGMSETMDDTRSRVSAFSVGIVTSFLYRLLSH